MTHGQCDTTHTRPNPNSITNPNYYYYYYIHLMAFFQDTWASQHQKGKPFWILLEQEMIGLQWHQLDHMQIICTSLQTDNHASTSPLTVTNPKHNRKLCILTLILTKPKQGHVKLD